MGNGEHSNDVKKHLPSLSIIVIYDTILGDITVLLLPVEIVMLNVSLFSTKLSLAMVTVTHTVLPTATPTFTVTVAVGIVGIE